MGRYKNISKFILAFYLAGHVSVVPVFAQNNDIQLRGNINDASRQIKLKGGVNIDKSGNLITLNLRDSDVRQVLRMLADKAGMNIILHESVTGNATLDLNKVTVNRAFEYVMTLNQLTYWQDGNTIVVASKAEADKLSLNKSSMKPIKIKYMAASTVAQFLNSNIFSLNKPDASTSTVAVTNPNTNEVLVFGNDNDIKLANEVIGYLDKKPSLKSYSINYASLDEIAGMICSTVFSTSGAAGTTSTSTTSSSSSSSSAAGSNTIYCGSSSTAATAVNAGTSIASAQSFASSGWWLSGNPRLSQLSLYGGTDEQIKMTEETIKRFDKKNPQVYIEISIIELNEDGEKALNNTILSTKSQTIQSFRDGTTAAIIDWKDGLTVSNDFASAISMVVKQNKGRILANPRIIASNNKQSKIDISSDFVEKRTIQREGVGINAIITETVSLGQAGIQIELTPKISPNGYVTLNLKPSYTSVKGQEKSTDENGIQQLVATLLNRRDLDLSDIRIKDGETLVIGGLIQERENKGKSKVPLLGDIPVIGALFQNNNTSKERSELIIMITPKIIKEDDTVTAI